MAKRAAQVGESIILRNHHGQEIAEVVAESCGKNGGQWVCGECGEGFPHNMAMWNHADEHPNHPIAWNCFEHGPERP